ncbi:MAG TPA: hypothetical protein DIT48_10210 [Actinobacteria bacterium]|jgi:hypothetical protein|nr:hypothetical protein [Actinomycetota bacterium]HCP61348.1 hypothetical protein [Actinomycetota bacterium]
MALPAYEMEELEHNPLYQEYLRALERHGQPTDPSPSPGHAIRHCASCGLQTMFRLDPEGTWYECLRCKHYA